MLCRHGRDLEITRKTKKDKLLLLAEREPPPELNLTARPHAATARVSHLSPRHVSSAAASPGHVSPAASPPERGVKRSGPVANNNLAAAKKLRTPATSPSPPPPRPGGGEAAAAGEAAASDLSVLLRSPENGDKVKKIVMDFRLALHEDLNGNR